MIRNKSAAVLSILFAMQGAIFTFLIFFATIYIKKTFETSTATLSLIIFFIMLPYYLKILCGLAIDSLSYKIFGSKKFVIAIFSILEAIFWLLLSSLVNLLMFCLIILAAVLCFSLVDSYLDAYIWGSASKEKRGVAWGISWGMKGVGASIFSAISSYVIHTWGWTYLYYTLTIIMMMTAVMILFLHEVAITEKYFSFQKFRQVFRWKCPYLAVAFFILNWIPLGIGVWMYGPFINSFLKIPIEYASIISCLASLGNLLGSFINVGIVSYRNPWKAWKLTLAVYSVSCLLLIVNTGDVLFGMATALIYGIGRGFIMANGLSLGGELVVSSLRATMLALYSSSLYLGFSIGGLISGQIVYVFGYQLNFVIAASLMIPTSSLLFPLRKSRISIRREKLQI
jgi:MFS family permease